MLALDCFGWPLCSVPVQDLELIVAFQHISVFETLLIQLALVVVVAGGYPETKVINLNLYVDFRLSRPVKQVKDATGEVGELAENTVGLPLATRNLCSSSRFGSRGRLVCLLLEGGRLFGRGPAAEGSVKAPLKRPKQVVQEVGITQMH
jgi:hypothetical protein